MVYNDKAKQKHVMKSYMKSLKILRSRHEEEFQEIFEKEKMSFKGEENSP